MLRFLDATIPTREDRLTVHEYVIHFDRIRATQATEVSYQVIPDTGPTMAAMEESAEEHTRPPRSFDPPTMPDVLHANMRSEPPRAHTSMRRVWYYGLEAVQRVDHTHRLGSNY